MLMSRINGLPVVRLMAQSIRGSVVQANAGTGSSSLVVRHWAMFPSGQRMSPQDKVATAARRPWVFAPCVEAPAKGTRVDVPIDLARAALASHRSVCCSAASWSSSVRRGPRCGSPSGGINLQQHGFVHDGVISYLIDNTITFAAGAILGPDIVTGGFTIDYLRPATGQALLARAHVLRAGTTHAVGRCDVSTPPARRSASQLPVRVASW